MEMELIKVFASVAGIAGCGIFIVKRNMKDIETLDKKVVYREGCIERHKALDRQLERGEKKFDNITALLQNQADILGRIDERTIRLVGKD